MENIETAQYSIITYHSAHRLWVSIVIAANRGPGYIIFGNLGKHIK